MDPEPGRAGRSWAWSRSCREAWMLSRRAWLGAWCVGVVLAVGSSVQAQEAPKGQEPPKEAAKKAEPEVDVEALREEADRLAQRQQYRKAIDKYKQVLQLRPNDYPVIYFNLGEITRFLEDFNEAALFYQRYLELEEDAPDRKSVEKTIAQCRKQRGPSATLTVKVVGPSEPLIVVNGIPLSSKGEASFDVGAGAYNIEARGVDFEGQQRSVRLSAGEAQTAEFTLKGLIFHGDLLVEVQPEGVEVFVDGQKVGVTPLAAPVRLETGKRYVELKKEGFFPWVRNVYIDRDGEFALKAQLEKQ